jgi:hypothetical protein
MSFEIGNSGRLVRPDEWKTVLGITLLALCVSACSSYGSGSAGTRNDGRNLAEDEKHRLYTAALAESESPLDSDLFQQVCKRIGIFDASGKPNDYYMTFVAAHVDWGMKPEIQQFRKEINTREKAREYINKHLSE